MTRHTLALSEGVSGGRSLMFQSITVLVGVETRTVRQVYPTDRYDLTVKSFVVNLLSYNS